MKTYDSIRKTVCKAIPAMLLGFALIFSTGQVASAQILNDITRRAKNAAETKIKMGADRAVHNTLDKAGKAIEKGAKNAADKASSKKSNTSSSNVPEGRSGGAKASNGSTWYVSSAGSNKNDGKSPETPYKNVQKEDVSSFFRVKDAEPLFSEDCMSGNLFELSSNMATWIFSSLDRKDVLQLANDYPAQIHYLEKATKNDMLRQMLLTHFYNQLLDANEVEHFEEYFSNFNENVTYPLLKLSTRDRYVLKKSWQENPRALSNAILNADKPRDGQALTIKENEGLKLLRSVMAQEEGKVVYVTIGATWCPASRKEVPFQQSLASDEKGKPLRVVNFWLDEAADALESIALGIENYHLTDAQRAGLDPILHLGKGIPFYILIDKDGVIVDFGEHLRPSIPETKEKIEAYY